MATLRAHLDGITWEVLELPGILSAGEIEHEGLYNRQLQRSVKPSEPQAFLWAFADMFVNSSYYFAVVDEEFTTPRGKQG